MSFWRKDSQLPCSIRWPKCICIPCVFLCCGYYSCRVLFYCLWLLPPFMLIEFSPLSLQQQYCVHTSPCCCIVRCCSHHHPIVISQKSSYLLPRLFLIVATNPHQHNPPLAPRQCPSPSLLFCWLIFLFPISLCFQYKNWIEPGSFCPSPLWYHFFASKIQNWGRPCQHNNKLRVHPHAYPQQMQMKVLSTSVKWNMGSSLQWYSPIIGIMILSFL